MNFNCQESPKVPRRCPGDFLFFNFSKPEQVNEEAVIRSNLVKITAERDDTRKSLSDAEEAVKRANTESERALEQSEEE